MNLFRRHYDIVFISVFILCEIFPSLLAKSIVWDSLTEPSRNLIAIHCGIVFIPVLILCVTLPSLHGESVVLDKGKISRISAEEIARRRKLLQTYLLEIEDKQKDWIETYMSYDAHDTDSNVKQNMKTSNFNTKPYVSSKIHLDRNNIYHCSVGNKKENFLHVIKELTDMKDIDPNMYDLPQKEVINDKNKEINDPIYAAENTSQVKLKKNNDLESKKILNPVSEELHIRQKSIASFMSSLDKGKEKWIETYEFSYKETDSEEIFKHAPVIEENMHFSVNPKQMSKNISDVEFISIKERLYFHRWLKKLLNKLIGHPYSEHVNIVFSLTPDTLNQLQKLSTLEKYEISEVDELISDLISNSIIYDNNISSVFASFASYHYYIIVSILLSVLLFYALKYYPIFRILLFLIICILWHGYKMYQQKVAEKHATLSASSPEYCNSILNNEYGIFAHIKEFFRYSAYDDHCKKYFEALMIDPIAELSLFMVVSDFVSSSFFQLFRHMGSALNFFVKDSFEDLSFFQSFYLIVILIIIAIFLLSFILIYNRYKLNFPFFMGSVEPTTQVRGSRVEDIALEPEKKRLKKEENCLKNITKKTSSKTCLFKNNDTELQNIAYRTAELQCIYHAEHCNLSQKSLQDGHQSRISGSLKRRLSC